MYKKKSKEYFKIAIIYYIFYIIVLFLITYFNLSSYRFSKLIYFFLTLICILIVCFKDKKLVNLGLESKNLLSGTIFTIIVAVISFIITINTAAPLSVLKNILYYLISVSLTEEIIFRGFLQSYLFGLKIKPIFIYIIGAIFFSLSHIPLRITFVPLVDLIPELLFCFFFHLFLCFITKKENNIAIPVGLHFIWNYFTVVAKQFFL